MRYASQRDRPLVNLLQRAAGGFLLAAALLIILALRFANDLFAVLAIILAALGSASLWTLRETWYEITPTRLRIRSGPSRMSIPWESLQCVAHSRDKRNAPALSFRRLRIDYKQGKRRRTVLISPMQQEEFLQELCDKAQLGMQGDVYARRLDVSTPEPPSEK